MSTITGGPGTLGILNVGHGDTKLSFDPENPAECIRAARIVTDMLRRGYALLVEVEVDGVKKFQRVHRFDEARYEYIIADFDPVTAAAEDEKEERTTDAEELAGEVSTSAPPSGEEGAKKNAGRKGKKLGPYRKDRIIPAGSARGLAIARTAGG